MSSRWSPANGALISLAEIARRTGLHRSTGHHLLQTLVGLGYLRQDPATRSYELSAKLFQLTGRTWTPEQLGVIAQPLVAELARVSGEGASLAAYRDGAVKIVAKCDHDGPVRVVQDVGAERPIHATAVGKAIVAFLPAAELEGVLSRLTYERYTPRTIVEPARAGKPNCAGSARPAAPTTTRSISRASAASRRRCASTAGGWSPRSAPWGRRAG